ncbi:protein tamozhennic [Drosophila innubila]|uniref:protein tamozhennic n=1 Tax=Drosophila innubila TaxID=198719 RepID=UPI00148C1DEF|nr:protein tamozhennic [Drosophila innubila]XP_034475875.1 protein tamozhennic [Drosophila innubila]
MSRHANMSDFVPCVIQQDLWEEILRRHWTFLETEESIKKLEDRKKLEVCLKEFLCVVSHDRKFFLPETGQVLRNTVCELNEFTAQNAIVGFEAISQYANNLFTKPWRKEFRMLKTYSGSYQHEVESNLIDADRLFLAMGYHRIAEDTFVLEGPICPDQVTNVSRDAMIAYVECQIMKHIYAGLSAAGFSCSWQDIFHYRERHVGGVTQTIKEMAYRLHEKRLRKEQQQQQLLSTPENTYSNLTPNRCDNCVTEKSPMPSACALHGQSNNNPNSCALHHSANQPPAPPTNLNCMYPHPQSTAALMTHSRSLEHYQEPHASLPHRHSFDQHPKDCAALHPQGHLYEAPYDCLDGLSMGSSASYAAVAGAYNAPGNRYPLPYNISSQLNAQYATPLDGYANAEHNNANVYASIGKPTTTTVPHSCGYHGGNQVTAPPRQASNVAAMAAMQHRQSTYPPDQHLIDFDERAQLMQHDFNDPRLYEPRRGQSNMSRSQGTKHSMSSGVYVPPRDAVPLAYAGYDLPTTLPQPTPQDMYVYARPVPKSSRIRAPLETGETLTRQRNQLMDPKDNNRKATHKELRERISLTAGPADGRHQVRERDMNISDTTSYESPSLDEFTMLNSASPPLIPKVQEGVGSFESWNYVFKNLERSGYSKDLGDREDLLVQSLDLDSLTLANGGTATAADKRRPETHSQPANVEKSRTLEKKRETRVVQAPPPTPAPNSSHAGVKKVKSALKTATIDNRASGSNARTGTGRTRSSGTGAVAKQPPPVSTQLIVTSPNEWSCRFCTFLNPDTKRICEMCCRSKDFNLEAAANVSQHASSTCV